MIACGLDFGTSNSAIGVTRGNAAAPAPLEDDRTLMPSAVFFDYETKGHVLFGSDAISAYVGQTEGRLMRALKSILGSPLIDEETSLGGRKVPLTGVVELFVRHLKDKAEAFAGQEITSVVHGRPVRFVDDDSRADARAQDVLEAVARRAGFRDVRFVYEPIAAAHHYERTVEAEELVLIADIGGGTSDFSIVRIGPQRRERADRSGDVLASAGVRVGGTDFDAALSLAAVMPLLGLGSGLIEKNLPMPNALYHELATWATINFAYTYKKRTRRTGRRRARTRKGRTSLEGDSRTIGPSPGVRGGGRQNRAQCAGLCSAVCSLCRGWPDGPDEACRFRARHRSENRSALPHGRRLHRGSRPERRRHRHDLSHGRIEPRAGGAGSDCPRGAVRPLDRRFGSSIRRVGIDAVGRAHDLSLWRCGQRRLGRRASCLRQARRMRTIEKARSVSA